MVATDASSACRHKALLGLIDDVDCAVVSLTASLSAPTEALTHVATVPAFAYVTTGMGTKCIFLTPIRNTKSIASFARTS